MAIVKGLDKNQSRQQQDRQVYEQTAVRGDVSHSLLPISEAEMGLEMAMRGMKIETFLDTGLVGERMANMMRAAFNNSVKNYIDAAQKELAERRNNPKFASDIQGFGPITESIVLDVFNRTLESFARTKDAMKALQDGAEYSMQVFLNQDYVKSAQNTYHYKTGLSYFSNFYQDMKPQGVFVGPNNAVGRVSSYQQFANSWNHFLYNLNQGKLNMSNDYDSMLDYLV